MPGPDLDHGYLHYWLSSNYQNIRHLGGGDQRDGLNLQHIGDIECPVPPFEEQRRIAAFLDDQVARIDRMVAARRRQLMLLEEARLAAVAHLLEGQPTQPLRRLVREAVVGIVVTPSAWYTEESDGVPALRGTDVSEGAIAATGHVLLTPEGHLLHPRSRLRAGDVVVVRTGDAGSAAVVPDWAEGWNAIDLVIVRVNADALPEFVELVLNTARHDAAVSAAASGSIQQHFGVGALLSLEVPMPPIDEQVRVTGRARDQREATAQLRSALDSAIDLFEEYKRSLTAAAVTGGFDVSSASGRGVPA